MIFSEFLLCDVREFYICNHSSINETEMTSFKKKGIPNQLFDFFLFNRENSKVN
jgi:hypothetical protein